MEQVYLGLGSNLGDRSANLEEAISQITTEVGELISSSSVMETPAWGFLGPPFFNKVIKIKTKLNPIELLQSLKGIEKKMGRSTKTKIEDGKPVYTDRLIDIDILIYGFHEIESEELTIPHPAMLQRDFVMIPLREIVDEETWKWINRTQ